MAIVRFFVTLSILACLSLPAPADNMAFLLSGELYRWNLDKPDTEPEPWSRIPAGFPSLILLAPDGQTLFMPVVYEEEGKRKSAIVTCDARDRAKVSVNPVEGITRFVQMGEITTDGKSLFVGAETDLGECLEDGVQNTCLVINTHTFHVSGTLCAFTIWPGPKNRLYYFPHSGAKKWPHGTLLSRDERGNDERKEISLDDLRPENLNSDSASTKEKEPFAGEKMMNEGLVKATFAHEGRLWIVLVEGYGRPSARFVCYSVSYGERPRIEFVHPGVYIAHLQEKIYYQTCETAELGICDCRKPEDKQLVASLETPEMGLDGLGRGGGARMSVAPDGKKIFFWGDTGQRTPISLCILDVISKQWSKKYEVLLGGGPTPAVTSVTEAHK